MEFVQDVHWLVCFFVNIRIGVLYRVGSLVFGIGKEEKDGVAG